MSTYIDLDGSTFSFSPSGKLITDDTEVSPYYERDFLADENRRLVNSLYSNSSFLKTLPTKELKTLYYLLKSANEIIN